MARNRKNSKTEALNAAKIEALGETQTHMSDVMERPVEEVAIIEHVAPQGWTEIEADEPTLVDRANLIDDSEMVKILAEADENAMIVSSPLDHGTQFGSWKSSEQVEGEVLENVVSELEAEEAVQEPSASGPTLYEQMATLDQDAVNKTTFEIASEVDKRAVFQEAKNPDNANMPKLLKKVREQMVQKDVAKVLLATSVDPAFMNRVLHDGSCYNVYAIGKVADIVKAASRIENVLTNAINIACMKSLFAFQKAGMVFDQNMARAAASDKIRISDAAIKKHLIRHTVSASTAPTQASSTMQALATLGVVKTDGSHRNPVYTVLDTPLTRLLQQKLAA